MQKSPAAMGLFAWSDPETHYRRARCQRMNAHGPGVTLPLIMASVLGEAHSLGANTTGKPKGREPTPPMLIGLLAFFTLLAAYCYHVGWRHGGDPSLFARSRGRGGFFLSLGFMGMIASFIWIRAGARDRLSDAGITPHPALVAPSGLAAGQAGATRTWVFETSAPGKELLDFYRDPSRVASWQVVEEGPGVLIMNRDGERLVISGGADSTLVFMITPERGRR